MAEGIDFASQPVCGGNLCLRGRLSGGGSHLLGLGSGLSGGGSHLLGLGSGLCRHGPPNCVLRGRLSGGGSHLLSLGSGLCRHGPPKCVLHRRLRCMSAILFGSKRIYIACVDVYTRRQRRWRYVRTNSDEVLRPRIARRHLEMCVTPPFEAERLGHRARLGPWKQRRAHQSALPQHGNMAKVPVEQRDELLTREFHYMIGVRGLVGGRVAVAVWCADDYFAARTQYSSHLGEKRLVLVNVLDCFKRYDDIHGRVIQRDLRASPRRKRRFARA